MISLQINKSGYHQLIQTPGGKMSGSQRKRGFCESQSRDLVSSVYHTRALIKRIIHNNFVIGKTSFLTLTFKSENFSDYSKATYEFTKFIKRLNYFVFGKKVAKIKYFAVPEMQKRGVWHFHVLLFDIPYIDNEKISELWGLGYIKVNQIKDVNEVVKYVSKYITKEMLKNIQKNRKRVFTSKGLDKGYRISGNEAYEGIHLWLQFLYGQDDCRLVFSKKFVNENNIQVLYEVYFSSTLYEFVRDFFRRRVRGMRKLFISDDVERCYVLRQISKIAMEDI